MAESVHALVLTSTSGQLVPVPQLQQQIAGHNNIQAAGNVYVIQPVNPLIELLKALDCGVDESAELEAIAAELQHYFSERDVVGLEVKLQNAGRDDLLVDAKYEKHRFSQKLAALQFSLQLRKVYHHILAMLVQRFRGTVLPLICSGASPLQVDAEVTKLVSEVYSYTTVSKTLNLTETDINAMLFFLTGNCHIKWSK